MMDSNFIELGVAYLCGIMMPGPSTTLLIRNSLLYSRSSSIQCSLGIVFGIGLQAGMILIGTNFIEIKSVVFTVMKVASALFLIYLGINSIACFNKGSYKLNDLGQKASNNRKSASFIEGLLLEILNPLALTFFISILTSIVDISVSTDIKFLYWAEILTLGTLWFCSFALLTSSKKFVLFFGRFSKIIGIIAGFVFLFIGFSILTLVVLQNNS
jgi:threonine efflux protein